MRKSILDVVGELVAEIKKDKGRTARDGHSWGARDFRSFEDKDGLECGVLGVGSSMGRERRVLRLCTHARGRGKGFSGLQRVLFPYFSGNFPRVFCGCEKIVRGCAGGVVGSPRLVSRETGF